MLRNKTNIFYFPSNFFLCRIKLNFQVPGNESEKMFYLCHVLKHRIHEEREVEVMILLASVDKAINIT